MFNIYQITIVFLVSTVGGFIQRITGFGFGIFVMMFLPHIMETHNSSAAISTLVSCGISVYNAIVYRKDVPYKKILPLILAALVSIPIAVHFSVMVSGDFFKKMLGIVLIILSIYFLVFNERIKMKPNLKNGLIAGGVSGVLTGLFSTGGPPVVLYLMNAMRDNVVYFASIQFYFGVTGIYSTLVRVANGIVTPEVIIYSAIGFAGCVIGNFVGRRVFDKLQPQKLKQIIYLGMIVSGIVMAI